MGWSELALSCPSSTLREIHSVPNSRCGVVSCLGQGAQRLPQPTLTLAFTQYCPDSNPYRTLHEVGLIVDKR